MATGGSGDVLTGMITGFLAQGMAPIDATLAGVYLHGLAGDLAVRHSSEEAVLAGDIIDKMGEAFNRLNYLYSEI
jgi:NAD(P)H-hydrate epimerase